MRDGKGNYDYNAQTGEYTDMIKAGILDPTKVVRTACRRERGYGLAAGQEVPE